MKKTTTFLMIVSLSIASVFSQNWDLYKQEPAQFIKHEPYSYGFFSNNSNVFGLTLSHDTIINRLNSVLTIFKSDYSDSENFTHMSCSQPTPSLLGDSLLHFNDTSIFYIGSNVEIFWVNNSSNWTFYSDGINIINVSLDSVHFTNSDSVKYYSFTTNAPVSSSLHQFDKAQIVLSKSRGILEGFDFSEFPDTLERITFFQQGGISNREIYNYEIGDEYHYINTSYTSMQGVYLTDKFMVTVIDKSLINSDSVTYKSVYKVRDEYMVPVNGHPTVQSTSFIDTFITTTDLTTLIGSGNFIDTADLIQNDAIGFYDDSFNVPTYSRAGGVIYVMDTSDICNMFFEQYWLKEYVFGVGSFLHTADATGGMGVDSYNENLVYYKKGTTTWGNPISIIVGTEEKRLNKIQLYPNPAHDFITLKGLQQNTDYQFHGLTGKLLNEGSFTSEIDQLNVEGLKSGVYFLKLTNTEGSISKKIIVQ